jgi:hypothetical protein
MAVRGVRSLQKVVPNPSMPRPRRLQHRRESAAALRVWFKPGWEMDLRKELVLAVEEEAVILDPRVN